MKMNSDKRTETSEVSILEIETEGLSQSQIVRKRFFHHRGAIISMFILLILVIGVFTSLESKIFGIRIPGWWKFSIEDLPELELGVCADGRRRRRRDGLRAAHCSDWSDKS